MAGGVDAAELGIGRLVGHHRPRPLAADARRAASSAAPARGSRAQAISAATSAKRETSSSVFCVGVSSFRVLLRASASAGRDPELLDHLGAVEQRHLRRRRRGDEEARVVALGPAERRQPVAEIDQRAGIEADAFLGAHLGDAVLAPVQRAAPRRQPVGGLAVERVVSVADGAAEQQPRLLEALADRGDEEVEAAALEAELGAGRGVVDAEAGGMRVAVARIDDAARETPRRRWCSRCRRRGASSSTSMPPAPSRTTTMVAAGRGGRSGAGWAAGAGRPRRRRKERSSGRRGEQGESRVWHGAGPGWLPSATSDSAALDPPTARSAPLPIAPGRRRREDGLHRSGHLQRRLRTTRSSPCFTMPSFSS